MPTVRKLIDLVAPLSELPAELAGWQWVTEMLRAIPPHYTLQEPGSDWTTKGYQDPARAIAEAKRRVLSTPKLAPGQPPPEPWPDAPEGWRWNRRGAPAHLIAPDGWKTANYNDPQRALAEAQEHSAVERARWGLVAAGYDVQPQGMHWVVRLNGSDATVLKTAELLDLASSFPPAPPVKATPPHVSPGSSAEPLPLMDLISALEDHAAALPKPLPTDHRIPLPGLPERFPAPLDLLIAGRYQPRTRFDQEELDQLAASITEHGILTALKVFANERGQLELIAGERRLRAARQAGLAFVPVEVCSYSLRQIDEISTIDNLQRTDLSPIEEGTAYERMIREWGISEAELARRLGKNRGYIQQRRAIAGAAPEILQALDAEAITFSQARAIALAAPGEVKIQQQALKKMQEQIAGGRRITEREAQRIAETTATKVIKKKLEALGWKVSDTGSGVLVWSVGERPRLWTGAELLRAASEKLYPDGKAPRPRAILPAEKVLLDTFCLYRHDNYDGWVVLHGSYPDRWHFLAPEEVPTLCAELAPRYQAMVERYQAAGWTLTHGSGNNFTATSGQGRTERPWRWDGVEQLIADIEAGKIDAKPAPTPKGQVSVQATKIACGRCGKKTSDYRWRDSKQYCLDCTKLIEEEIAAIHARIRSEVAAILMPWLEAAPLDAARLLIASRPGRNIYHNHRVESARQIRAADSAALARAIVDWVATAACEDHAYPVYGQAVADVAAAADEVDTILALSARLSTVESWIASALHDSATLAEITLQRATVEAIGDDLQNLVDDDDTDDDIYEDMLHRIGAATEQLLALAEVGAAPKLAEVEA
jgi:ParB family chromosome partitioning protein